MKSKDCLNLLMSNQKKVKDGFKFINLKTHEQATIEDCYENIKKDLEILEILKKYRHSYSKNKLLIALYYMKHDELKKINDWLKNG